MYIPTCATNMKDKPVPKVRLLLQGEPGTGKTWSAMTFPNPTVLDLDDGMGAFVGQDIPIIPLHNHDYITNVYKDGKFKSKKENAQPDRRGAVLDFLRTEAIKMGEDQTLIIDGLTGLENSLALHQKSFPIIGDKGIDTRAGWQDRLTYYSDFVVLLKALLCHSAVTCHERKVRNEQTNELLDKTAPLMQGSFVAQIKSHFSDCFRTVTEEKKNQQGKVIHTDYFWQVTSDKMFEAKTKVAFPDGTILVEPNYAIFSKYPRVTPTNPYATTK